MADELDTAERDRQERIKRRIDFDLDEDIFEPPHTSSRLGGGRRRHTPTTEDTEAKLRDMTIEDIARLPATDAKKLLDQLPNDPTMNAICLAAKVMSQTADTTKTMKRSNDFVSPPITRGTKTEIDPKTDKHIKVLFGPDAKYSSPTDRTVTMRELLTRHSEVTTRFDLDTATSMRVLKTFSGGFLRDTLERMEREKYSLNVMYQILQTSYQDSPTVGEARRSLEAVVARADHHTNVYLLVTNLIKISYDIFQFSPTGIRQTEAITNTTNHLFAFLYKTFERKGVAQLQDNFNVFRDSRGANLSEQELWTFIQRVEYFCAFESRPLRGGDQPKPHIIGKDKESFGRINDLSEDYSQDVPHWTFAEHLPKDYDETNPSTVNMVQDVQPYPPRQATDTPAQFNQQRYSNNVAPQQQQKDYQNQAQRPNVTFAPRGSQTLQPQPSIRPQILQHTPSQQGTFQGTQAPHRLYIPNQIYPDHVRCRLCNGNWTVHKPPFHRNCTVFPLELPTGLPCPQCKGEHRISNDNVCRNLVLPTLRTPSLTESSHTPHPTEVRQSLDNQDNQFTYERAYDTTFPYVDYQD